MAKLSFCSDKTVRINLEEGTWVDVKEELSYEEFTTIMGELNVDSDQSKIAKAGLELLCKSIVAWSDEEHPCNEENIRKLNTSVIIDLTQKVLGLYTPEKKS